jgi:hypothetical protein
MRWELILSWAKDSSVAAQMINARSETAGTKPALRNALIESRGGTNNRLHLKLRVRENDRVDVREECDQVRVFYRSFAGMCAVIAILKIHIDEPVSLIAIEKTHALTNRDEVSVENSLEFPKSSDIEFLVPSLMPAGSLRL